MNIEEIQSFCKELPFATEDIKWGQDLVFSIGGKMFCVVGLDQVPTTASFKVTEEEFELLTRQDGFMPAPYVAKYKWVLIKDISVLSSVDWKKYLRQSYELVKEKLPNKVKKQLSL